ncbi:MAG: hypothetical protein ACLRQX_05780 [Turicibacter sanguinis]
MNRATSSLVESTLNLVTPKSTHTLVAQYAVALAIDLTFQSRQWLALYHNVLFVDNLINILTKSS